MNILPRKKPSLLAVVLLGAFGLSFFLKAADPAVAPTIAESDTKAIDKLLEGKTPGPATQNLFTTVTATVTNMVSNVFVRNPHVWTGPNVDLTAVSAYDTKDDGYGTKFAITAISPIHCIGAAHANLKPGTQLNFVGVDNMTATREVVSSINVADDIDVYLLDSELPRTITPMKILPADWAKYLRLGDDSDTPPIPVLFVNQADRVYCAEATRIGKESTPMVYYHLPSTNQRAAFNTQVISGDSSFPEMLLIRGEPVLLSCWHFGGYGAGPLEASHFDEINAAMHTLSTKTGLTSDYQLTTPNLRGFRQAK